MGALIRFIVYSLVLYYNYHNQIRLYISVIAAFIVMEVAFYLFARFKFRVYSNNKLIETALRSIEKKEYDRAVSMFKLLTEREPDNQEYLLNYGYTRYVYEDAAVHKSKPSISLIGLTENEADFYTGMGLYFQTRYNEAINSFNSSIDKESMVVLSEAYIILCLINLGEYTEGIEYSSKAIEMRPDYWQLYNNRGLAYFYNNDKGNALADFNKALMLIQGNDKEELGLIKRNIEACQK